jgi:uncharacterized lipoprotein YmbA
MKTRFATLMLPLTALLLGGCSSLLPEAQPDPTRFYVLTASAPALAGTGDTVLGLRNVEVAAYLRSRSLIVRRGEHEVEFREFARWGEALDAGIARTLRENLLAADAIAQVAVVPFAMDQERDYDMTVRVLACEGEAGGAVRFRATWELWSVGAGAEVVERGHYEARGFTWDGRNEASLAAALSQAVAGLAAEITAALGSGR